LVAATARDGVGNAPAGQADRATSVGDLYSNLGRVLVWGLQNNFKTVGNYIPSPDGKADLGDIED
jgi:hypothetical protein